MLKGKVAVVTGSAQGLGKAFTHILLENGAQVTSRNTYFLNKLQTAIMIRSKC